MLKPLYSVVLLLSILVGACGLAGNGSQKKLKIEINPNSTMEAYHPTNEPQSQSIIVFAAASLTDAFLEIGRSFEATNPGGKVDFSFAGSQVLRSQLEQGAVADLFASADYKNMDLLISEGLVDSNSYRDFVTNHLVVIVPSNNPAELENLQDLSKPGIKLVLADSSVPAGNYARQILSNMSQDISFGTDFSSRVLANVVSNETDVRQVVTKVELGEADAGIVYVSDALAAPNLITIPIPGHFNVIAKYPLAILSNSPNPDLAAAFIDYVMSPEGQAIMNKWGFSPGKVP